MAVINKLRNSKWVLIVILVSLLIFVLTDFFSGNNNISTSPDNVGEIDGTGITVQEFETKYREILAQFEANGQAINDESKDQASMYAWNQFIQANIVEKEYNKLGLDVTLEESSILLYSDNAHPTIKQYFSQDGVFSPSNVINFRNQVAAKDPKSMEQFEMIVKQIVLETKSRKYTSLISKSMYATSLDAEDDFFASSSEANGKSITLNFGNLDDKDFKVTDNELKSYLKKHASDFKQKESRDLEYVMVSVLPTLQDTLAIKQEVEALIPTFRTTDNDSLFVSMNSSEPFDPNFQSRGSYDKSIESRLFSAPKDSIIGPLYANGVYSLVKVLDTKLDSVFYMSAFRAEIYVKGTTKQDTLDAIAKAKKLAAESKSSANPMAFLQEKNFSGELGTVTDMGWFREGTQPVEFNKAFKTLAYGDATVVQAPYGLFLVKLNQPKSNQLIKIAQLKRKIEPMSSTQDSLYQVVSDLRNELVGKDGEFDVITKKFKLNKGVANNVKATDKAMTGIPGTSEVVRWSYNDKRENGDYSDVIVTDNFYIVARLAKIKEEGTADFEEVKEKLTRLVIDEKKADKLKSQMNDAIKSSKTVDEIAGKLNTIAHPIKYLYFNASAVEFTGNDMALVGYVFGLNPKTISKPIVSKNGVHLFFVDEIKKPELPTSLKSRQDILYMQKKQQAYSLSYEALKKAGNVVDERYKYY